jgi:hypothetical protein
MFAFTEAERATLMEIRAITTDSKGQELLVGLTLEETAFCMEHRRRFLTPDRDREGRARYLELMERHEKERLSVIGSEIQLRNEDPPRH